MMQKVISITMLVIATIGLNAQSINTDKSNVVFEIGNMKFKIVEGTFKGMSGTINFNPSELSSSKFNVCVDASSVNTGSSMRDKHLKEEDFFHVEHYPNICFESLSIEKMNGEFLTKGNLTMHGVTKQVEIPFVHTNNTFSGKLKLNRLDYKLGEETGTFMVSNEVEITINCVVN